MIPTDWTSRAVEIDGEMFSVEYMIANQLISVRVIIPGGASTGMSAYNKGDVEGQLVELTRELLGRA